MGEIIARPLPPIPLPFTGERLTSEYGGQTEIEHLHRYLLAREWCRDKDVLDVASGEGYGSALLSQVARSTLGVEIAQDAVEHATGAYAHETLSYRQGDARALPLTDAAFDVVVSFETIEHFSEQERFLDEVRRVLRPGGLLIVSTPDRDNYSRAESPANPYHVRELTGAEFETLLRSRFESVSLLLQRPTFGSVLFPTEPNNLMPLCFERRGAGHFEASAGLARPQYLIAFASGEPVTLPASVYIETGSLGVLSPLEAEAQIRASHETLEQERARAAAEIAALTSRLAESTPPEGMRHQAESEKVAAQVSIDALASDLVALRAALEEAQGEARGHLAANEMAERACMALRNELQAKADRLLHLETAAARANDQLAGALSQLERASVDLSKAQAQHAGDLARIREKEAELAQGSASISSLQEQLRRTDETLSAKTRLLEDAQSRLAMTETWLSNTGSQLTNTLASHSWRITAPLRRVSRLLYPRA